MKEHLNKLSEVIRTPFAKRFEGLLINGEF